MKSKDVDKFAVASAIWIMASNDPNPLMTYRGLVRRLELPESDVREVVQERPDLFRLRAPETRLEQNKRRWLNNEDLPPWLKEMEGPDREKAIKALHRDDTFLSQFRTEKDAERSSPELITWGLEHIDRMRKARLESLEARMKIWLVLAPVLSGLFAFAGAIGAALLRGTGSG